MPLGEIRSVTLVYPDSLSNSFGLEVEGGNDFKLYRGAENTPADVNPARVRQFLVAAGKMRYEGAIIPSDPIFARKDSLLASTPRI
jgi:hypothetical protein